MEKGKFLIIQTRPEIDAAQNELDAFLKFSGLSEDEVDAVNLALEKGSSLKNLSNYSGIIMGGGPLCVSKEDKTDDEKRLEENLLMAMDEVVKGDLPFLGACLGIGILGKSTNCKISKKFGEDVGAVTIKLTEEGKKDDILYGLPDEFLAFVGHKEACEELSYDAVLLASSDQCPIQMFRVKNNVYASQFHPELDNEGIALRINIYKHHGYFPPESAQDLIEKTSKQKVVHPMQILKNFIKKFKTR